MAKSQECDLKKNKLVCIVGMCGSGKSIVADEFVKAGYGYLRFGQITLDEVKRKYGSNPPGGFEKVEKEIREGFRKKYGMGAFATLNISKFDQLLEKGDTLGDGLYSWSEYKILKGRYKDRFYVVAIYASPKIRYQRLSSRRGQVRDDPKLRYRSFSEKEAKSRDYAEIENIEKGGPIAIADYIVVNTSTMINAIDQAKKIIKELKSK